MNELNSLPDSIRIKYCLKGDKHFRLYNCAKSDFNYRKLASLVYDSNSSENFTIKVVFSNLFSKEEKIVQNSEEFENLVMSENLTQFYDSKYNCIKLQFVKEANDKCDLEKIEKLKEKLINDKNSSLVLNFLLEEMMKSEAAKNDLFKFLEEKEILSEPESVKQNKEILLNQHFNCVKEYYESFVKSKSSLGKYELDVSMQNLEEREEEKILDEITFSTIYDINEMNLISNEELIRDSTVFRTKRFTGSH